MEQKRILIVEDEAIVAMSLQETLENLLYAVIGIATTGADAIRISGSAKPDLVLMDIHLDDEMDGIEAAGTIFEQYCIPVVYLTAHYDEETLLRAIRRSQPYGYLTKPFKRKDLYFTIENAFHKHNLLLSRRSVGSQPANMPFESPAH